MFSHLFLLINYSKTPIIYLLIFKQIKFELRIELLMSHAFSDEQTVDKGCSFSVQKLIDENNMKDIALNKASNLIDLLSIQLEVEKNGHQEAIQLAEEEIQREYETQIARLKDRIQFLERELKRKHQSPIFQPARNSRLVRTNSSNSLQNNRRRTINRRHSELVNSIHQRKYPLLKGQAQKLQFQREYLKMMILENEWQNVTVDQLERLVVQENGSLQGVIEDIELSNQQVGQIFEREIMESHSANQLCRQKQQMFRIIKEQQVMISYIKSLHQELIDLVTGMVYKLNSIFQEGQDQQILKDYLNQLNMELEDSMASASLFAGKKIQEQKVRWELLESENKELRSIIDGMIALVRNKNNN